MFDLDVTVNRADAEGRRDCEIRQMEIFRDLSDQRLRAFGRWQAFADEAVQNRAAGVFRLQ